MARVLALLALLSATVAGADTTSSVARALPSIAMPSGARLDKIRYIVFYRLPADVNAPDFFNKAMPAAGWTATDPPDLRFAKDGFEAFVMVTGPEIMITVMRDEPRSFMEVGAAARRGHRIEDDGRTASVARSLPAIELPQGAQLDKVRYQLFYDPPPKIDSLVDYFTKQFSTGGWKPGDPSSNKHENGSTEMWAESDAFGGYVSLPAKADESIFVSVYTRELQSIIERQN
jgi:hypothetical protein